jgi:hypothetical protein
MRGDTGAYWKSRKEKLLKMFESLSKKDLDFEVGREDEMLDILSYKLGKSKQELLRMIVML